MKAKIFISLSLCVLVFLLSSCSGGNLEAAYLDGYPRIPFAEQLKKEMEEVVSDMSAAYDASYDIKWEKGWNGDYAPDTSLLNKGEAAVTCIAKMHGKTSSSADTYMTRGIKCFMAYNSSENKLYIMGAVSIESTEASLQEIISSMDGLYGVE